MSSCRICGNAESNRIHATREMMFGLADSFEYLECGHCGCVQIAEIPADLARYYPADYYSFAASDPETGNASLRTLRRMRNRSAISGRGLLGVLLHLVKPAPVLRTLRPLQLRAETRILDVGSGSGTLLDELYRTGFRHVLGVDPFVDADRATSADVRILKCSLGEVEPDWDVIMFHHSFEHVPDPLDTLLACARLLNPGGTCLIRMPNARSEAWRRYGVNWVQLDPPRHLHVHTPESLGVLATRAGLKVDCVACDSYEFQFWGSEQYLRDIPLNAPNSYGVSPSTSIFSRREIRRYRREARRLNAEMRGDQAAYYLSLGTD